MKHELKILPKYFDAVEQGIKTFEVRKNDRGFAVGDLLRLREFDEKSEAPAESLKYTGRTCDAAITYILDDTEYCPSGYVILGIKAVQNENFRY